MEPEDFPMGIAAMVACQPRCFLPGTLLSGEARMIILHI